MSGGGTAAIGLDQVSLPREINAWAGSSDYNAEQLRDLVRESVFPGEFAWIEHVEVVEASGIERIPPEPGSELSVVAELRIAFDAATTVGDGSGLLLKAWIDYSAGSRSEIVRVSLALSDVFA